MLFGRIWIWGRIRLVVDVLGRGFQHLAVGKGDVQNAAARFAVLERTQADGEFVAGFEGVPPPTLSDHVDGGLRLADPMRHLPILIGYVEPQQAMRIGTDFSSTMDTIDEGYFQTMGIAILRGRAFLPSDTADSPRVAVVNEHFAKHYWPAGDAVGKHIRLDSSAGTPVEIVGIAQTIKSQNMESLTDFVYIPLAQHPVARMVLMLRSTGDPLQLVEPVKDVVRYSRSEPPDVADPALSDFYLNQAVRGPRIAIDLVGSMGLVGLLLAVAGLYGLVAYNVSRRTREIGIRIALGAASSDVLRLVLGKGLVLVGTGTVVGLVMGFALEQLMNSMLFDSGGVDILAYAVVVPTMFLVTMLAAYFPPDAPPTSRQLKRYATNSVI